ncbi:MAG: DnaJ domain-containing protein [Bacteroidota bacterium]
MSHLPEGSTKEELDRIYKNLISFYHPDRNPDRREWAEEKTKQLIKAKELINDPAQRQYYINTFKQQRRINQVNQQKSFQLKRQNQVLQSKLLQSQKANGTLGFSLLLLGLYLLAE